MRQSELVEEFWALISRARSWTSLLLIANFLTLREKTWTPCLANDKTCAASYRLKALCETVINAMTCRYIHATSNVTGGRRFYGRTLIVVIIFYVVIVQVRSCCGQ